MAKLVFILDVIDKMYADTFIGVQHIANTQYEYFFHGV